MLEDLRGSRNDMDFMVADFENGDNAKDLLVPKRQGVYGYFLKRRNGEDGV